MKAKRFLAIILLFAITLTGVALTACGDDDEKAEKTEKTQEIQDKYAELAKICNEITEYMESAMENEINIEQADIGKYSSAIDYINKFREIELDGKSIKELDDILKEINSILADTLVAHASIKKAVEFLFDEDYYNE